MTARRRVRRRFDYYLSGPISSYGKEADNIAKMIDAAKQLRTHRRVRVFCPPENEPRGWPWTEYMRSDIEHLVACEALVTMPNWERSKGARLEVTIAKRINMPVISLEEALNGTNS